MMMMTETVARQVARLKGLIREVLPDAEENTYGGAKVTTILYSLGGPSRVVCGIGPGKSEDCLLYLHRISQADSPVLRLGGKGRNCLHFRLMASRTTAEELAEDRALRELLQIARDRLTS